MLALLLSSSPSVALQKCSAPPGDVTGDGTTDILDIQCTVLTSLSFLSGLAAPACLNTPAENGDIGCDGNPEITDVLLCINLALSIPLNVAADADQDGCPDGCEDIPVVLDRFSPVSTVGTANGAGFSIRGLGQSGSTAGKTTVGSTTVGSKAVGTQP